MKAIASLALIGVLTACGGVAATPTPSPAPTASPSPAPTAAPTLMPSPTPESHTVKVRLTHFDGLRVDWIQDTTCQGDGGYSDLAAGLTVTLRDQDNSILAAGSFGEGHPPPLTVACEFRIDFEDVPAADFYQIEIGSRGAPTYSYDEMVDMDWKIDLELGDRPPGYGPDWTPRPF